MSCSDVVGDDSARRLASAGRRNGARWSEGTPGVTAACVDLLSGLPASPRPWSEMAIVTDFGARLPSTPRNSFATTDRDPLDEQLNSEPPYDQPRAGRGVDYTVDVNLPNGDKAKVG